MQDKQNQSVMQRFEQYRASKTVLFWSCMGSAVLAIVIGFSWGGWVTGGGARTMVEKAAAQARQDLATVICVDRFMAASDARTQLTGLKEMTSVYDRSKLVEAGGWAIMPGSDADPKASSASRKTASLCAEELANRETPANGNATEVGDETPVAQ